MNKQKGFTLVELLVVIAIIGLLSTLAVVSLNNARMKSRDAKRVADVKQLQTALEMYFNDNNNYPVATNYAAGVCLSTGGFAATCGAIVYMNSIPNNPSPFDSATCGLGIYTYAQQGSGASYTVDLCLGAPTGGLGAGLLKATPGGIK